MRVARQKSKQALQTRSTGPEFCSHPCCRVQPSKSFCHKAVKHRTTWFGKVVRSKHGQHLMTLHSYHMTFFNGLDNLLINWPLRNRRLSWPDWLNNNGWFTHRVATQPTTSLAQDRETSMAEISVTCYCYASKPKPAKCGQIPVLMEYWQASDQFIKRSKRLQFSSSCN